MHGRCTPRRQFSCNVKVTVHLIQAGELRTEAEP